MSTMQNQDAKYRNTLDLVQKPPTLSIALSSLLMHPSHPPPPRVPSPMQTQQRRMRALPPPLLSTPGGGPHRWWRPWRKHCGLGTRGNGSLKVRGAWEERTRGHQCQQCRVRRLGGRQAPLSGPAEERRRRSTGAALVAACLTSGRLRPAQRRPWRLWHGQPPRPLHRPAQHL